MNNLIDEKDEMIMALVHYFVTEENYTPINVQGANNEVWLENLESKYKIVRINSKYIHNTEQYEFDLYKMGYVIKQIKKKTLSLKMNVLNICLDLSDSIKINNEDNKIIDTIKLKNVKNIQSDEILKKYFPKIVKNDFKNSGTLDDIITVTEDINKKTIEENGKFEDIFKKKKIIVTKALIVINILMYIVSLLLTDDFNVSLVLLGANNRDLVLNGEFYRLLTSAFLHGSFIHLMVNMYSLWLIGTEVETYMGKTKFLIIYLLSALMGGLFSVLMNPVGISIGASGAIFGLLGALLYFGCHYRLYLAGALKNQIIPIIAINLTLGFMLSGIDNFCHIGGLIGGYLATMITGIKYKSNKTERINGIIVYTLLFLFLVYALFNLV